MDAAHRAAARDRGVALPHRERMAEGLLERLEAVVLEEHAAVVAVLGRGEFDGSADRQGPGSHA